MPNGFETLYGHLSRINVRAGQRVTPGRRRSGAVGMTGLATGPHLDYRMTRNGVLREPAARSSLRPRSPSPRRASRRSRAARERHGAARIAPLPRRGRDARAAAAVRTSRFALDPTRRPHAHRQERPPRLARVRADQPLAGPDPRRPDLGLHRRLPGHPAPGRAHGRGHRAPRPITPAPASAGS